MKSSVVAGAGALVALGFLFASAVANYLFGASLGRSPWEAHLYGAVGVLSVAMNALAPFYISWSLAAKRRTTAASIMLLWALCLTYSTSSALGFAGRPAVSEEAQARRHLRRGHARGGPGPVLGDPLRALRPQLVVRRATTPRWNAPQQHAMQIAFRDGTQTRSVLA